MCQECLLVGHGSLSVFGFNLGKVGHTPSARLARTGYKKSQDA